MKKIILVLLAIVLLGLALYLLLTRSTLLPNPLGKPSDSSPVQISDSLNQPASEMIAEPGSKEAASTPMPAPSNLYQAFASSDDENQITGTVTSVNQSSITIDVNNQPKSYSFSSQVGVNLVSKINTNSEPGRVADIEIGDKVKLSLYPSAGESLVIGVLLYK